MVFWIDKMEGEGSFLLEVGIDEVHKVETKTVGSADASDTGLVDCADANVGCCSGKAKAESPAALVKLFSTFIGTLVELVLASFSALALLVLVGALTLDALHQFGRLGQGKDNQQ